MNRRSILLIFFIFTTLGVLSAQANYDLLISINQGFRVFESDEYNPYQAPEGIGFDFRIGDFWKSLNLGFNLTWSGFAPVEQDSSFKYSGMLSGMLSAAWMFTLIEDSTTTLTLGPIGGAGIYHRSISWDTDSATQVRALIMTGMECMLKTDSSMLLGTSFNIRGFMDVEPVWGFSVAIHVGYRFGKRI